MTNPETYYSQHSPMTHIPNEKNLTTLIKDLPTTIPEIIKITQNSIIHISWAETYGEKLTLNE